MSYARHWPGTRLVRTCLQPYLSHIVTLCNTKRRRVCLHNGSNALIVFTFLVERPPVDVPSCTSRANVFGKSVTAAACGSRAIPRMQGRVDCRQLLSLSAMPRVGWPCPDECQPALPQRRSHKKAISSHTTTISVLPRTSALSAVVAWISFDKYSCSICLQRMFIQTARSASAR